MRSVVSAERFRSTSHFTGLITLAGGLSVHGGFAAVNRGADCVKYLVPSLLTRTRNLTGHRD